jgi:hypothetical protein
VPAGVSVVVVAAAVVTTVSVRVGVSGADVTTTLSGLSLRGESCLRDDLDSSDSCSEDMLAGLSPDEAKDDFLSLERDFFSLLFLSLSLLFFCFSLPFLSLREGDLSDRLG